MNKSILAAMLGLLYVPVSAASNTSVHPLLSALQPYCQQAFAGRLISSDAADQEMAGLPMVVHLQYCGPAEMRLAFHVGADASRTWVLRQLPQGLQLKHEHLHQDGSPDELTRYGGLSTTTLTDAGLTVPFPADGYSQLLFQALGRQAAVDNTWAFAWQNQQLTYSLRRAGRHFAVQFDLRKAVAVPPPAWGAPSWADNRPAN